MFDFGVVVEIKMSSVECLREFVNERLIAAAEEIFGVFTKTVIEYEEEIHRQRRLLDMVWKPHVKLHKIGPSQDHDYKQERVFSDQQPCTQGGNSSLDHQDPEPPRIKREREELWTVELPLRHVSEEDFLADQQLLNLESDSNLYEEHLEPQQSVEEEEELRTNQGGEQLDLKLDSEHFESFCERTDHIDPEIINSHDSDVAENQAPKRKKRGKIGSIITLKAKEKIMDRGSSHSSELSVSSYNPLTGESSFKCDACGETFRFKSGLKTHLRIHKGKDIFKCNFCRKVFSCSSLLKRHTTTHTREKPLSCETCGKAFRWHEKLKAHTATHTGVLPHSCSICGKGFVKMSDLKDHIRIHTGEKPFICKVCGKSYRISSSLKNHMRVHTNDKPHSCSICGKRFAWESELACHFRIHTGEKPFRCTACGRCFTAVSNLIAHVKGVHTGEMPHCCPVCGKRFVYASQMKTHMRAKHAGI